MNPSSLPVAIGLLFAPLAFAQDAAPPLPEADTTAARDLFDKGCQRMLALASGTFRSDEEQDMAMMRGQNLPMGNASPSVRGGWNTDLVWGDSDDEQFVVGNGRMVVRTDSGWRLRSRTLGSGAPAPFLVSPRLLFQQLAALPEAARKIVHVEAGEVGGKPVAILTLLLRDDAAADLALGGALPPVSGGVMFGLGMMGRSAPEKTWSVDVALSVDVATGDVLRVRAKVYEDNPMLANMRIQLQHGNGDVTEEPSDATSGKDDAGSPDQAPIKKGLPDRKPGRTESVAYCRIDFKDLGTATPPSVDDAGKRWLGAK